MSANVLPSGTFYVLNAMDTVLFSGSVTDAQKHYAALGFPDGVRIVAADNIASGTVLHTSDKRTTDRGDGIVVSDHAVERIALHEAKLLTIGIALPPPVYAPGSTVVPLGEENFRTQRTTWEQQTPIRVGLEAVRDAVRAERRIDGNVAGSSLRMTPEGMLTRGKQALALEENGFRLLLQNMGEVFPRALPVLLKAKPDARADFFNRMMEDYGDEVGDVKIRTREYNGVRSVFAVTSPTYGVRDADCIAEDIIAGLEGAVEEARGEVVYDPATTNLRVNATWHARTIVDLAAGDVFQLGASYSSNDARGGSIIVDGNAWRNLCLNLIIIGEASANLLRRRHRGNMASVAEDIKAKTECVTDLFASFADSWGILRKASIANVTLWGEKFASVPEALAWAVEHKKIDADVKAAVLAEAVLTGWKEEQGNTLADLLNAVTRSHMSASINQWQREQLERAAGQLVPVLVKAAS